MSRHRFSQASVRRLCRCGVFWFFGLSVLSFAVLSPARAIVCSVVSGCAALWMHMVARRSRFCPNCDALLNPRLRAMPVWCWCGKLVDTQQLLLGERGEIDLDRRNWPAQPIARIVSMLTAINVTGRSRRFTIEPSGTVWVTPSRNKPYVMAPIPGHIAPAVIDVFESLGSEQSAGAIGVRVPLNDGSVTTVPANILVEPTASGSKVTLTLKPLREDQTVAIRITETNGVIDATDV